MTVFIPGMIPLFLMKIHLRKNFVFHSNLSIKQKLVEKNPEFYQEILTRWGKYFKKVFSAVASQCTWYNEYIKIDSNTIYIVIFFKCTNDLSIYTTERHLWIYRS